MNWRAVAVHLADRGACCALLDRSSIVRLFSLGLERQLGWARDQVEGRPFEQVLVAPQHRDVVAARLARAFEGTLPGFDAYLLTRDGALVLADLEIARVGDEGHFGLLLSVRSARPAPRALDTADAAWTYEIATAPDEFGELRSLRSLQSASDTARPPGDRCYRVLHGCEQPCGDCPILQPASNPWPRTLTRRLPGREEVYEAVVATSDGATAKVQVQRIPGVIVSAIHEAKVESLADSARLSEREREVLRYLLLGRALADIAMIMTISLRTVKFHQANIFEKLGVDSRSDLIRLIV